MKQPSFLERRTLGPPNYLLIATAAAFVLGLIPYGFWQALRTNTNALENWLPARYAEQRDLSWFRHQFLGEHFVVVSWDDCTLGNAEQLNSLARRLRPDQVAGHASAGGDDRSALFAKIITGPEMIDQLTSAPINLSRAEAIRRLEGFFVGPIPRTARGRATGDEARATCLVAFLSDAATRDHRALRSAIGAVTQVAINECGVPAETIRLGGPPVQEVAISTASGRGLILWGPIVAIAALCLCYFCLQNWLLAGATVACATVAACMSVALVYYFGALEVFALKLPAPRWGTTDAVVLVMPLAVYVISLAAGLFLVNYYLAARREFGLAGAAELAVRQGWLASVVVAIAAATAVGSFAAGDVAPIHKFGAFSAASVLAAVSLLFAVVPIILHRFPPNLELAQVPADSGDRAEHTGRLHRVVEVFSGNGALTAAVSVVAMVALGAGLMYLSVSGRPLALLAGDASSRRDYAWLERNVANLMPVEIVVTAAPERMREPGQSPVEDGQQYRMTLLERLELVQMLQTRIEAVEKVSGVLSAATFIPKGLDFIGPESEQPESPQLPDAVRQLFVDADVLQMERSLESGAPTGRELWHFAGRVAAVADGNEVAVDYDEVMRQLRLAVDPVLEAYERRDEIVRQLSARGKPLAEARIAILYREAPNAERPLEGSDELLLGQLLERSGTASGSVAYVNLDSLKLALADDGPNSNEAAVPQPLVHQDAVVVITSPKPVIDDLARRGVSVVDLSLLPTVEESARVDLAALPGPRPLRAVFTGMAPLLEGTQQDVVQGFVQSLYWAGGLVFGVLAIALWSPIGALLAMLPIALPAAVTFGAMGWMGLRVDVGAVLTASVGVGVALTGTVHYLIWFRRASKIGYSRKESALIAFDRCAAPMFQTFIVAGLSLAVLALSDFAPLKQLSYLGPAQLALALICEAALLPAMVACPLGRFFGGVEVSRVAPVVEAPGPAPRHDEAEVVRPRRAAAVRVDAGGRNHAPIEERRDASEEPHSNLQERLQRLRRRPRDLPS